MKMPSATKRCENVQCKPVARKLKRLVNEWPQPSLQ